MKTVPICLYICFAVGIGIHWNPLETIGKPLDPRYGWSVQSMFHGGCPITGWFHTDNPEMADFRGPLHETSIPDRKNLIYVMSTYDQWSPQLENHCWSKKSNLKKGGPPWLKDRMINKILLIFFFWFVSFISFCFLW